MESLGFVNDVVLLTAVVNQCELQSKFQQLAGEQISWARGHGAIFDIKKSKWIVFTHSDTDSELTITFGERTNLRLESKTCWLGVILDSTLSFKRHWTEVIAKGVKRAHFLSNLSNTK